VATLDQLPFRRIVMVRHGHYERTGELGDAAWTLSALGRQQAARAARRLVHVAAASDGRFEGVYASPWPRATETAEATGRLLELQSVKLKPYLREAPPLVGSDGLPPPLASHALPPSLEIERKLAVSQVDRVLARFFKVPTRTSLALVFTHGNLIRYVVARILNLPYEAWITMDISHCSFTDFRVFAGGYVVLAAYNETGHLPPSMITSS
jgi:broad specificity phosphatase PhoE